MILEIGYGNWSFYQLDFVSLSSWCMVLQPFIHTWMQGLILMTLIRHKTTIDCKTHVHNIVCMDCGDWFTSFFNMYLHWLSIHRIWIRVNPKPQSSSSLDHKHTLVGLVTSTTLQSYHSQSLVNFTCFHLEKIGHIKLLFWSLSLKSDTLLNTTQACCTYSTSLVYSSSLISPF